MCIRHRGQEERTAGCRVRPVCGWIPGPSLTRWVALEKYRLLEASFFLGGGWSAKYKNNILRIVLKIGDSIHKTQRLVKYQKKSIIIIIIVICDVILVNSYVPY